MGFARRSPAIWVCSQAKMNRFGCEGQNTTASRVVLDTVLASSARWRWAIASVNDIRRWGSRSRGLRAVTPPGREPPRAARSLPEICPDERSPNPPGRGAGPPEPAGRGGQHPVVPGRLAVGVTEIDVVVEQTLADQPRIPAGSRRGRMRNGPWQVEAVASSESPSNRKLPIAPGDDTAAPGPTVRAEEASDSDILTL